MALSGTKTEELEDKDEEESTTAEDTCTEEEETRTAEETDIGRFLAEEIPTRPN